MPKNSDYFTGEELLKRWDTTPFELRQHIKENGLTCVSPGGKTLIDGIYLDVVMNAYHRKGENLDKPCSIDFLNVENMPNVLIKKQDVYTLEIRKNDFELTLAKQKYIAIYFLRLSGKQIKDIAKLLYPNEDPEAMEQQVKNGRSKGKNIYEKWTNLYES